MQLSKFRQPRTQQTSGSVPSKKENTVAPRLGEFLCFPQARRKHLQWSELKAGAGCTCHRQGLQVQPNDEDLKALYTEVPSPLCTQYSYHQNYTSPVGKKRRPRRPTDGNSSGLTAAWPEPWGVTATKVRAQHAYSSFASSKHSTRKRVLERN